MLDYRITIEEFEPIWTADWTEEEMDEFADMFDLEDLFEYLMDDEDSPF